MKELYRFIFMILLFLIFLIILTSCNLLISENRFLLDNKDVFLDKDNFVIFFIDVGQGDCILIKTPQNRFILVDSGPNTAQDTVMNFFDTLLIKNFDVVIATHPHEDHIGNMPKIIEKYRIEKFYTIDKTTNTATFEDMLYQIKNKKLKINIVKAFDSFTISDVDLRFLSPLKNYDDLNESSAVVMLSFKGRRILLTGDISKEVENDILDKNIDVKADVLKVAHHGSYSSTSKRFLSSVNPVVSIISVGKDNPYGHPHKSTLKNLESHHTKIFTTMDNGHIAIVVTKEGRMKLYTQK